MLHPPSLPGYAEDCPRPTVVNPIASTFLASVALKPQTTAPAAWFRRASSCVSSLAILLTLAELVTIAARLRNFTRWSTTGANFAAVEILTSMYRGWLMGSPKSWPACGHAGRGLGMYVGRRQSCRFPHLGWRLCCVCRRTSERTIFTQCGDTRIFSRPRGPAHSPRLMAAQ